jgi:hypothetical protein
MSKNENEPDVIVQGVSKAEIAAEKKKHVDPKTGEVDISDIDTSKPLSIKTLMRFL